MYILTTFYFQKNEGDRGLKQVSTYKKCYEIKKISTSLLFVEEGGAGGGGGGGDAIFTKKKTT